MKKFFALALLSSFTFQTRAVGPQDAVNLLALPFTSLLAASQFEKGDAKDLLEKAAYGSALASSTRGIVAFEGKGLDSNFQDLAVESGLYTALLKAGDYLNVDNRLGLKRTPKRDGSGYEGLFPSEVYNAAKTVLLVAAVNVLRAGIAQVPVAKYLLAAADEVQALVPVFQADAVAAAAAAKKAATAVANASVKK